MAAIQVSELRLAGYDLLQDSESFLNELASQETQAILGGHSFHGHSHDDYSHDDYSRRDYSHRDYSHRDYSRHGHWH